MTTRRYRDGELVDFAIVGSGAAGGIIARELSQAGLSVVLLEQGPRLTPAQFEHDELKYWFLSGITNDAGEESADLPRRAVEEGGTAALFRPSLWYARTVGGTSVHYTANYWRFHPIDFNERSALGPISGTGFADWPLDYAELEPYYTKVDWDIGVSGLAGASPFDPPRTKPYPMPPLPVKSSGVLFERGARKLGLHPFPAPMAINSVHYAAAPRAFTAASVTASAARSRAKASTLTTTIPQAEATGRCEVRSESYVVRIETDARGRATGVAYFDAASREHFQNARAVIVCANGAETPRLLLMSESARFPQGLANSSGLVGKYLMFNTASRVNAVFEHELNEYKSVQVSRILHDFYDADPKRGFYGGGGLDARMGPQPTMWAQRLAGRHAHVGRRAEDPAGRVSAFHGGCLSWHVATRRNEQRHAGSRAEGCLGHARHPRHLQGSSGRSSDQSIPPGSRRRDHGGGGRVTCD